MKTSILSACFTLLFVSSYSQSYIYYLDTDLNSVKKDKAVIIGKGVKLNGSFRLDCYSAKYNQLYMAMHFSDSSLAELDGLYTSYHLNGKPEKQGNFNKGFEEGEWQEWDDLGRKTDSSVYKGGYRIIHSKKNYYNKLTWQQWKVDSLIFKESKNKLHKDFRTYTLVDANAMISDLTIKDSLKATLYAAFYKEDGSLSSEANFTGDKGELKRYTTSGVLKDSVFTRELKEAAFPGGPQGWMRHLQENMDPNVPIDNNAPSGTYNVIVQFIIETDGSISDIQAQTKRGYGMEEEVIRMIRKSPKWQPAVQYGINVRAYRRQPVTFSAYSE